MLRRARRPRRVVWAEDLPAATRLLWIETVRCLVINVTWWRTAGYGERAEWLRMLWGQAPIGEGYRWGRLCTPRCA